MTSIERILGSSLDELRATRSSVKWRFFEPDVLPVWVAEMDARPCPEVVDVVTRAVRDGDTGYAWAPPFIEAFTGFADRRWGWRPDPEQALLLPDVMIGIEEMLHTLTEPSSAVVVSPPCYDSFHGFVEAVGRRPVHARLDEAGRLDPETLAGAFAEAGRGSAYLLANPANPTGVAHTRAELAMLAGLADEHGVLVLSDEIHAPLVRPGVEFTPYLSVPEAAKGIALVSASKSWNLAGLKAALAFPGAAAAERLASLHEVVTHGANHLGVLAQSAAYEHGEPWLDQLLGELDDNRLLLEKQLGDHLPGVRMMPAEATYLAWLDCSALGLADPATEFLERGRVALSAGTRYDREQGSQWARFNLATSPEVIEEAVRRMARTLG
ncbi:cystathionine beta-lyase [Nocardioides sp. Soil797]|nr:cystathionine beta-lyase [Nocardioides sp. Soil797]